MMILFHTLETNDVENNKTYTAVKSSTNIFHAAEVPVRAPNPTFSGTQARLNVMLSVFRRHLCSGMYEMT